MKTPLSDERLNEIEEAMAEWEQLQIEIDLLRKTRNVNSAGIRIYSKEISSCGQCPNLGHRGIFEYKRYHCDELDYDLGSVMMGIPAEIPKNCPLPYKDNNDNEEKN